MLSQALICSVTLLFVLANMQLGFAASKPGATPGQTPLPTGTAPKGNFIQGTVASIFNNEITLNVGKNKLKTIMVPSNVQVVRDSQPSSLNAIQATDKVFIQKDKSGKIVSVLAISNRSMVTPTAQSVPTLAPSATPSLQTTPTPATTLLTGTVNSVSGNKLVVNADSGNQVTVNASGVEIIRDGKSASIADLRHDDIVTVLRGSGGKVLQITANSQTAEHDMSWIWISLLLLVPLALLLAIPFRLHTRSFPGGFRRG